MKHILIIFWLIISIPCFAQTGSLKGHISYLEDGSDFASLIIVLIKDGNIITEAVTDSLGNYIITEVPLGNYELKISQLGFRDKVIKDFQIKEGLKKGNFIFPDPCITSKKICPKGHKDHIIPILYGYPTNRLLRKAKKGKIKLGSCIVTDCDPQWYCTKHGIDF
ncbi:carboxypeptidase-like regulatory domain-containing protein [Marinifilum fragile]|uniref:carboxypeptidase-like regulatory domain-containing protein n=1 Tax=Marinifilum fragile TaxID=570161 RepID=UPI002AA8392D|nr:carboxypeptidase-like regulatory domain-containing protein [Marinifilum fragile]